MRMINGIPETRLRASPTSDLDERPNARDDLRTRLDRRVAELTILHEIGQALQSATDLDRVAYTVLVGATAHQGLSFHRAFLLVVDSDGKTLRGHAAVGPDDAATAGSIWRSLVEDHATLSDLLGRSESSFEARDGGVRCIVQDLTARLDSEDFLARTLRGNHTVVVRDGIEYPARRTVEAELLDNLRTRGFVASPMHVEDRPVGLLIADRAFDGNRFGEAEVELLGLLAGQAAVAIDRARLIDELRRKAHELDLASRDNHAKQRRLMRSERLAALGQMAARVAHDVRTPLVVIGGYARSMLGRFEPDAPEHETLSIIVDEVRRMEGLLSSVLERTHEPRPSVTPVDVGRVALDAIELLQYELDPAGIEAEVDVSPATPAVLADRDMLFQALINLMHNSVQAMPAGGLLRVHASLDHGKVAIAVEDDGVGIPDDTIDRVTEPFFTTRTEGTGLGLPIVSSIARGHGGEMSIERREQGGTKVVLHLPAASQIDRPVAPMARILEDPDAESTDR